MFSLRIVSTSHYQAEPMQDLDVVYSTFRSSDVRKVPILRIFGATPSGQKTCMHIHGVFPYLFVPYDGAQPLDGYLRRFAASLDKAISVANNTNSNTHHVFKISLVSGIPMYGYHAQEQPFLKIYLYNPNLIKKAADLLLGGAVMNKSFQPHESHIPFPLQLFIDYNLYGMNLINVAAVKFRRQKDVESKNRLKMSTSSKSACSSPGSNQEGAGSGGSGRSTPSFMRTPCSSAGSSTCSPCMKYWDLHTISEDLLLAPSVERQSQCELEVDVVAADILNRREVTDNMGSNPGLAALWEDERQRRRDVGQSSQITPQESQEHENVERSDSELRLMERLLEIVKKQSILRRSESEDSAASVDNTTLTPEDSVCIPASQLEDHQPQSGSTLQSESQEDTVMAVGDEEEGDGDGAIISLESIQRVVSFSQSFSIPGHQPAGSSSGKEEATVADQSLVDILASLAEEGSQTSQHSVSHLSFLEDLDSMVGQEVGVPPDKTAVEADEEETLHMSQSLPHDINLEGLDNTWNESDAEDRALESSTSDDESIPQLDGTSDEKKASKKPKKSKKSASSTETVSGEIPAQLRGDLGSPSLSQPYSSNMTGAAGSGRMSSYGLMPCGMEGQEQMHSQQAFYGYQQWGDGSTGQAGGLSPYAAGHSPSQTSSGWSPSHSSSGYPGMYRSSHPVTSGNYGGYPYPQQQQRLGYGRTGMVGRVAGPHNSPQQTFSPPPTSPMSSPAYAGSYSRHLPTASPQYSAYVGVQNPGMAGMRRHSEGSMPANQGQLGGQGWQQGAGQVYGSSTKSPMSSPESWVGGPFYPGSSNMGAGQFGSHNPVSQHSGGVTIGNLNRPAASSNACSQSQVSGGLSTNANSTAISCEQTGLSQEEDGIISMGNPGLSQKLSQPQPSTLQALLEAPESSRMTHAQATSSAGHYPHRTPSVDFSPSGSNQSPAQQGGLADGRQEFKYPERRSASFSSPAGGMPTSGALAPGGMMMGPVTMIPGSSASSGGPPSALSNLYNFVSNVDPSSSSNRTPTPTSTSHGSTPSSTPTPSTGPSPMQEDMGFSDSRFGMSRPPAPQQQLLQQSTTFQQRLPPTRSMSVDEGMSLRDNQGPGHTEEGTLSRDVLEPVSLTPLTQTSVGAGGGSSAHGSISGGVESGTFPTVSPVSMTSSSCQTVLSTSPAMSAAAASGKLGKQNRSRKLGLTLNRTNRPVSEDVSLPVSMPVSSSPNTPATPTPCAAYTFTFHVPSPVYKRFKMRGTVLFPLRHSADIKVVRMHPRDARRYSLLKIGRELVRLKRMTPAELHVALVVPKQSSTSPEEHQSLIDPATGEIISSVPGLGQQPKSKLSLGKGSKPRQRLLGPKCKRLQAAAAAARRGQVAGAARTKSNSSVCGQTVVKTESSSSTLCGDGAVTNWSGTIMNTEEFALENTRQMFQGVQKIPGSSSVGQADMSENIGLAGTETLGLACPQQQSNLVNQASTLGQTGLQGQASPRQQSNLMNQASTLGQTDAADQATVQAHMDMTGAVNVPGQANVGTNSGPAWQTLDRDRRPTVKVEYPAQRQGQWPQDAWPQGTGPGVIGQGSGGTVMGQGAQQWGGQYAQSGWGSKGTPPYGYSQMMEAQQQSPGHYSYTSWPNTSPAYSSASSGPNPMPSLCQSPSDVTKGMGTSSYPTPYQQQGYHSYGQYNQGYGHQKFGYPGTCSQRYPFPSMSPHVGYAEQSPGYHQQGYMTQAQGMHNQYQQQGQFVPSPSSGGAGGSSSGSFQHNGGFASPQHSFPPSPVNSGQFPAASATSSSSSTCATSTPAPSAVQPPQFTATPAGQYPSPNHTQQGQYPLQQSASDFGQPPGPFASSGQAGQFGSPSSYPSSQFSPAGQMPGQYPQMMSPHMGYQGHFSPSTSQQQYFSQPAMLQGQSGMLSAEQHNCYSSFASQQSQYQGSFQGQNPFAGQGTSGNINGGLSPSSSVSQQSSVGGNTGPFLDTAKSDQPFLTEAACQAAMSLASETNDTTQSGRPCETSESPSSSISSSTHKDGTVHVNTNSVSQLPETEFSGSSDCGRVGSTKTSKSTLSDISDSSVVSKKNCKGKGDKNSLINTDANIYPYTETNSLKLSPSIKRSSVQLWSDGDSDSGENSIDSDGDSDEYRPSVKMRCNGRKRRCSSQKNPLQIKRTKRSSVEYGTRVVTKTSETEDGQKSKGRAVRAKKNQLHDKKGGKQQPLIEGVHYIVVGKFKGHKVMLVKVSPVRVRLNERVKVSDLARGGVQDQAKVRSRLLGPRCRRIARGTAASDPSFVQESDKSIVPESHSDLLPVTSSGNGKTDATINSHDPEGNVSSDGNEKSDSKQAGKKLSSKGDKKENYGKCSSAKGHGDGKGDKKDEDDEGAAPGDKAGSLAIHSRRESDQVRSGNEGAKSDGKCSDDSKTNGDGGKSENNGENSKNSAVRPFSKGQNANDKNDPTEHQNARSGSTVHVEKTYNSECMVIVSSAKLNGRQLCIDEHSGKTDDEKRQVGNAEEEIKENVKSLSAVLSTDSENRQTDSRTKSVGLVPSPTNIVPLCLVQCYQKDSEHSIPTTSDSSVLVSHSTLLHNPSLSICQVRNRSRGRCREGLCSPELNRKQFLTKYDLVKCKGVAEKDDSMLSLLAASLQTLPETLCSSPVEKQLDEATPKLTIDSDSVHVCMPSSRVDGYNSLEDDGEYSSREESAGNKAEDKNLSDDNTRDSSGCCRDDNTNCISGNEHCQTLNENGHCNTELDSLNPESPSTQLKGIDDKFKKQKQLTQNQRLGVAFVSKRRRKRNRLKYVSKGESGCEDVKDSKGDENDFCIETAAPCSVLQASTFPAISPACVKTFTSSSSAQTKVPCDFQGKRKTFCIERKMSSSVSGNSTTSAPTKGGVDSLALLHMATLASLEEHSVGAVAARDMAEEKENQAALAVPSGTVPSEEWRTYTSQWETRACTPPDCNPIQQAREPELPCEVKLDNVMCRGKQSLASESSGLFKKLDTDCRASKLGAFASVSLHKLNSFELEINPHCKDSNLEKQCQSQQQKLNESSDSDEYWDKKKKCLGKVKTVAKQEKLFLAPGKTHDKRKCAEKALLSIEQQLFDDDEESLDGYDCTLNSKFSKNFHYAKELGDCYVKELGDCAVKSVRGPGSKESAGCRKKRARGGSVVKKEAVCKAKGLCDSLDFLHIATLASLGSELPDGRDIFLPRYCDLATDHRDIYEESLIRMSYTSPVTSDLEDLSPPIPLSPEDIPIDCSKVVKRRRPMPCKPKVEKIDIARGTRLVFMSQVRAENAAWVGIPPSQLPVLLTAQLSKETEENKECLMIEGTPPSKCPSLIKLNHISSAAPRSSSVLKDQTGFKFLNLPKTGSDKALASLDLVYSDIHNPVMTSPECAERADNLGPHRLLSRSVAELGNVGTVPASHRCPHPTTDLSLPSPNMPKSNKPHLPVPYHPTMPDPSKLPTPAVPWNHPLYVFTEGGEGAGAWKDRVIHDALTEKHENFSSSLDIGEKTSPYLPVSQHNRDSQENRSEAIPNDRNVSWKTPPCSVGDTLRSMNFSGGSLLRTKFSPGQKISWHGLDGKILQSQGMPPPPPYPGASKCTSVSGLTKSISPSGITTDCVELRKRLAPPHQFSSSRVSNDFYHNASSGNNSQDILCPNNKTMQKASDCHFSPSVKSLPNMPLGDRTVEGNTLESLLGSNRMQKLQKTVPSYRSNNTSPKVSALSRTEMVISQMFNLSTRPSPVHKTPLEQRYKQSSGLDGVTYNRQKSSDSSSGSESRLSVVESQPASMTGSKLSARRTQESGYSHLLSEDEKESKVDSLATWSSSDKQNFRSRSLSYQDSSRLPPPYETYRSPAGSMYHSERSGSSIGKSPGLDVSITCTKSPSNKPVLAQIQTHKSPFGHRMTFGHVTNHNDCSPQDKQTPDLSSRQTCFESPEKTNLCSPLAAYIKCQQKTSSYGASLLLKTPSRPPNSLERSLSNSSSRSPISSPGSVLYSSGKAHSISPRQAAGDSTRPNRKRSIAEYLEDVIESTYADEFCGNKKPDTSSNNATNKQSGKGKTAGESMQPSSLANLYFSSSEKLSMDSLPEDLSISAKPKTSQPSNLETLLSVAATSTSVAFGSSAQSACGSQLPARSYSMPAASSSFTLTSSTRCAGDIPKADFPKDASSLPCSLAYSVPFSTAAYNSVCLPAVTSAPAIPRPIWTSIKTDKFENITDDEDEDVVPSSQETTRTPGKVSQQVRLPPVSQGYQHRFPGFCRLSSLSSTYRTAYNLPQGAYVSSFPRHSACTVTGASRAVSFSTGGVQPETFGHRYSPLTSGYPLSSQGLGVPSTSSYAPKRPTEDITEKIVACDDMSDGVMKSSKNGSFEESTQMLRTRDLVTSFDTQWQDTQLTTATQAASLHVSQFEPITDSEEEDDKDKSKVNRSMPSPKYPSTYPSSGFLPAYTCFSSRLDIDSMKGIPSQSTYSGSGVPGSWSLLSSKPASAEFTTARTTLKTDLAFTTSGSVSLESGQRAGEGMFLLPEGTSSSIGSTKLATMDSSATSSCGTSRGESSGNNPLHDRGGKKRKHSGDNIEPAPSSSGSAPSSSSGSASSQPSNQSPPLGQEQQDNKGGHPNQPGPGVLTGPLGESRTGRVLCPRAPPPSRTTVEASAAEEGLSVEPVLPAFCSHPGDLPDRPREVGGRVLKITSSRVKDLEDFFPLAMGGSSCPERRSLCDWQVLRAVGSAVLSSQPSRSIAPTTSLSERLQSEPQLRFALSGDFPCVISPVRPPPSFSTVSAWLEEKLTSVCKQLQKADTYPTLMPDVVLCAQCQDDVSNTSLPDDIDVPEEEREGGDESMTSSGDELENSMFTHLRNRQAIGEPTSGPSSPKRLCLDTDSVSHSTPIRRTSRDLFDSGCTPVHSESYAINQQMVNGLGNVEAKNVVLEPEGEFATPRRPPLRRLSTNTQTALRKALLSADAQQLTLDGEKSQIDGPTPKNTHGFKVTQKNLQDAKALHKYQYLTVMSMELHADSRGDLIPDPEVDAVRAIFYAIFDDIPPEKGRRNTVGAIIVDKDSQRLDLARRSEAAFCGAAAVADSSAGHEGQDPGAEKRTGGSRLLDKCGVLEELEVIYVESELELLHSFAGLVSRLDPDIVLGFEVQQLSWGYLLQRAAQLSVNLCAKISRIQGAKQGNRYSAEKDEWGADHSSEIHIEGRIVLNLWRILRHEVTLNIYSYENCAYHILHQRVPAYTFRSLTSWYDHRTHLHCWRVVRHYVERVSGQLAMLEQLDIIGKTSEFARVFGIEFFDVLSRGTQYRVESMMLRLAKPLNFIPVSPSVQQRARQKAAECIPLTLEPQSRFYTDPVVVLDFQSLYPSIMIAYNYCFSTCLGRLDHLANAHEGPIEFGCTSLSLPPETLKKLRKHVTVSPNGCVFVTSKVRRGVLSMMVEEILKTRLMVKKSMKDYRDDKTLHRMLDARQLGLKLIANVTYGYTGASYSGRMPCIEVADSIVRKARESLERAIQMVEATPRWQAQVVYGDTDSLFIHLPGRTKDQAFAIGQEIADTITGIFPKPMKLKFEKVYLPCVLQTKKRYVGHMFETVDQKEPVFDAKGIETVRRDNCGVASKILERCIKILFTSRDLSQVRSYLQRQVCKMLAGRVGLQDYIFAKEYRGMMGYKPGACVPALEIARKRLREDRRSEPRVGERVPYVIVHGSPGLPLIQLVRQPRDLLRDTTLLINVTYYVTKQVLPPLDRLLGLVGVSVFQWYADMPKMVRVTPHHAMALETRQGTISQYFVTSNCLVCERQTKQAICSECLKDSQLVAVVLATKASTWEMLHDRLAQICMTCMGVQDQAQACVSLDCPVLFRRHLAACDLARSTQLREALAKADLTF